MFFILGDNDMYHDLNQITIFVKFESLRLKEQTIKLFCFI